MSTAVDKMFDPPGPRGVRKARILAGVSVVLLVTLAAVVLTRFHQAGGLDAAKWEVFRSTDVGQLLWTALGATLKVAATAGAIAFVLGVVLAMLRLSPSRTVRVVVAAYVEVTRSLPTLLVLYFTVLFLPYYGVNLPVYWQLVLALTVTNAALMSELLRASLLSVPYGQSEAAQSLGLQRGRALRLIVLPQALRAASPALISQLVYLLKGTTLGYVISYAELLYNGRVIGEYTGNLLQSFLVVTGIYLVVNLVLSRTALLLQERLSARGTATVAVPLTRVSE